MIDIHAHILPKIDDGAQSLEESLEMLSLAEEDGITHIAATPHIFGRLERELSDLISKKHRELKRFSGEAGLSLEIHLACEVFITPDFDSLLEYPCGTFDGRGKFVLIEFSMTDLPFGYESILGNIVKAGVTPIIAHPERNYRVTRDLQHAQNMINSGAMLQVNSGSLLGSYGKKIRKTAVKMLEREMIFAVASDAHDTSNRSTNMSAGRRLIVKLTDEDTADRLTLNNPEYVLGAE